jgi:hypothetical protein
VSQNGASPVIPAFFGFGYELRSPGSFGLSQFRSQGFKPGVMSLLLPIDAETARTANQSVGLGVCKRPLMAGSGHCMAADECPNDP